MTRACRHCGHHFDLLRKDKWYCNHLCRRNWYRARIPALATLAPFDGPGQCEDTGQLAETGVGAS